MTSEIVILITELRNKQRITLPAGSYRFGRSAQCEYVLRRNNVGDHQFTVSFANGQWGVTDGGSDYRTWYNNRYLEPGETSILQSGDVVGLNTDGDADTQEITFRVEEITSVQGDGMAPKKEQTTDAVLRETDIRRKRRVLIGRGDDCDIKLVNDRVSRHHCEILYKDGHYELHDLGSTNGTYVDGVRVTRTVLRNGAVINVPAQVFAFTGGMLHYHAHQSGISIQLVNVYKTVKNANTGKPLNIVDGTSLQVEPNSFVVLVGGSGTGKSSLLTCITGTAPCTAGSVKFDGLDTRSNRNAFEAALGYVPQKDIMHDNLTVEQSLTYTAKLRIAHDATRAEIAACDGIIVAAEKKVDTARFDGKPVLFTRVDDGIHKPEELIKKIAHGEVPVFHAEGGAAAEDDTAGKDSFGRSLYKNLMNGVSHMLPFVVGGGIMIALAFLLDDYSINPANFGMNTPVAAFFKTVGGAAFGYMLPILAGFIAMSIADRPGLAVGFAGGVLAMNGTNFTDLAAGSTTGISGGFLAALLAGFAAGYIVQFLKKITEKLPASLNGIRPMLIYPLGGILIVGAMMCAVNPVMGMINTAMTDWLNALGGSSKVLLGAIVAGMMSVDMGGPVNKAAYVFGTAALASGNYEVMAAVMVGGMVPPIAIALSTTFCPRKWTLDERRNGIVNYVMGLCFVSEGAIPYAAVDPLRVLPSCVVGSAVAGALSMTFGCALRAPHGGIFVFPVVDHAALYCVALAVGSVLGAVILSLVKKTQPAEAK